MSVKIPAKWKNIVLNILKEAEDNTIIVRERARLDWEATFLPSFLYQLYLALADELEDPDIEGKKEVMKEPGETYAFFFHHQQRKLYAKICLSPDKREIIIYSAHLPLKGDIL